MKTFAAVFGHPESHGPQICALEMIARYSEQLDVLYRNVAENSWRFPPNVNLIQDAGFMPQDMVYSKSALKKIAWFFRYVIKMHRLLRNTQYDLIVLFDPMAFFAFRCIYFATRKKAITWYHNYDIIDLKNTGKYSLGWFAEKAPRKMFPHTDYFTLPMEERKVFFPLNLLKNDYQLIPNYSLKEIHAAKKRTIDGDTVKLLYVGSIGRGHGLEDLIQLLQCKIAGKDLQLVVKGYIQEEYKNKLIELAKEAGVSSKLVILPKGPWGEVPEIIRQSHIGIAIYLGKDKMNVTLGRGGSGKVFQYIAEGLPILMNTEFQQYFKEYPWAVPSDIDRDSLAKAIGVIINGYDRLSQSAIKSFEEELNCNIVFDRFLQPIVSKINPQSNERR